MTILARPRRPVFSGYGSSCLQPGTTGWGSERGAGVLRVPLPPHGHVPAACRPAPRLTTVGHDYAARLPRLCLAVHCPETGVCGEAPIGRSLSATPALSRPDTTLSLLLQTQRLLSGCGLPKRRTHRSVVLSLHSPNCHSSVRASLPPRRSLTAVASPKEDQQPFCPCPCPQPMLWDIR